MCDINNKMDLGLGCFLPFLIHQDNNQSGLALLVLFTMITGICVDT